MRELSVRDQLVVGLAVVAVAVAVVLFLVVAEDVARHIYVGQGGRSGVVNLLVATGAVVLLMGSGIAYWRVRSRLDGSDD